MPDGNHDDESQKRHQNAAAHVNGYVLRLAVAGLNQPAAGAGNFVGRKRQRFAQGIERLLQPFFHRRLFRLLVLLPSQGAQARPDHRRRGIQRRPETKITRVMVRKITIASSSIGLNLNLNDSPDHKVSHRLQNDSHHHKRVSDRDR